MVGNSGCLLHWIKKCTETEPSGLSYVGTLQRASQAGCRIDRLRNAHCTQASPLLLRLGGGHPSVALSYPSNYLTEQPTHEQIYERQKKKKIKTTKVPRKLVKLSSREFVITFSENIRP